ncbi:alpha/beta hydrolase-fold protein, partial [Aquimarina litoralis]|uniref:alpha/beta hydrolase-fold protein n=1 Tax=Aquimarina litoralis TaxID=584605 RepID=UPI001FE6FE02
MKSSHLLLITALLIAISWKQEPVKIKSTVSHEIAQNSPNETNGKVIIHENFESKNVIPRNVEVFLPNGYDSNSDKKYKVLYMHDGQNVFNPKTSYTGIDWGVDETIDSLIKIGKIKNTIVVAPWNTGRKRFSEYMPEAPAEATNNPEAKAALQQNTGYDS